ncbi:MULTISPECIES: response regulator transcription factor [Methylobacterium]|uniref:Transcriptional activator protein ExaE n=2 Tax=Pseudomonadota TaxID=1224 RepID=A0ABQ4SR03_9HYPH|nr:MULTISPECIES: response regulator transcription factor [Methylobacterium]PIU04374.1 MAG: DNA-binding response regulator [Methylobacterium sp. CG09_land_8_20_14_0_10_71_15]PIU15822.1 MAG: DNA-binding response regulator [Methylobacterium sp. CG08_land_8_20_14_0_20_71_15]GBU18362.1 two-component regulatory system response regulator NarL [Methylobacterium sp.]GJE04939.1 Transcriptional activator protein ExaE [Methylobacterium jeotgali]
MNAQTPKPVISAARLPVLVIDDHPIVLQGCRRVLEDAGVETVAEATNVVAGYRAFHRLRPPIVICDLTFQGSGLAGLGLIRRMRAVEPKVRVLVFSMHNDPVIVARALEAGALGYVLKDHASAELFEAFERVRAGEVYLDRRLATEVAMLRADARRTPESQLTPREQQILTRLAQGKSYGVIASDLSVSYKTVTNACSQMRQKLGVRTLAELIHVAVTQAQRQG